VLAFNLFRYNEERRAWYLMIDSPANIEVIAGRVPVTVLRYFRRLVQIAESIGKTGHWEFTLLECGPKKQARG
jgi:hypothetical protein